MHSWHYCTKLFQPFGVLHQWRISDQTVITEHKIIILILTHLTWYRCRGTNVVFCWINEANTFKGHWLMLWRVSWRSFLSSRDLHLWPFDFHTAQRDHRYRRMCCSSFQPISLLSVILFPIFTLAKATGTVANPGATIPQVRCYVQVKRQATTTVKSDRGHRPIFAARPLCALCYGRSNKKRCRRRVLTWYAAVRPVAEGVMRRQSIKPNIGLVLICSRHLSRQRPPVSRHVCSISWGFWRPVTLTFDLSTENWHCTYSCHGERLYQFWFLYVFVFELWACTEQTDRQKDGHDA